MSPEPAPNPGVGSYNIEKPFDKTLGHMALKLKKLTEFVNPAPSAYSPKENLTRPTSQRPINLNSDRADFSKSITGKVGPGIYEIRTKESLSLGKIGKSLKFGPNRNVNVMISLHSLVLALMRSPAVLASCQSTVQGQRS